MFLDLIGWLLGPSPLAAGVAVLLAFAGGILLAWRAFAHVLEPRAAKFAALMLIAAPSGTPC